MKIEFTVRWYYNTGCGSHYIRISKNGSTWWNENKPGFTAYNQIDSHVMDVKKGDKIKIHSNRSGNCVGGSGITDILKIKTPISAKSIKRYTYPISRVDISSFGTQYIEFEIQGKTSPDPIYLERLSQLDGKSRHLTRNSLKQYASHR